AFDLRSAKRHVAGRTPTLRRRPDLGSVSEDQTRRLPDRLNHRSRRSRNARTRANHFGFTMTYKIILLLLIVFAVQDNPPPPWARFEAAGFSVLMPGKPVETVDTRATYTLHSFAVTLGRGTY